MKKAVLILGFAMCTTFAMAQTAMTDPRPVEPARANLLRAAASSVDYKGSIFTKADNVVATYDFATASQYTYGETAIIGANDKINGEEAVAHAQTGANAVWARINSINDLPIYSDTTQGVQFASVYKNASQYGVQYLGRTYMGTENGIEEDNGFMFISLMEEWSASAINAYFTLPVTSVGENAKVVDVRFRQCYRKFYDQCFIDYKVNGNWYSCEVNITNVDVDVNGTGSGSYVATLPPAAVTADHKVELRFRALGNHGGGQPHGYFWCVDNVSIVVPESSARWSFNQNGYLDGFYGMIPQGFNIPISFTTYAQNRGADELTNVKLSVNHFTKDEETGEYTDAVEVVSTSQSNIPAGDPQKNFLLRINERGFMVDSLGLDGNTGYIQSWPLNYENYDVETLDSKWGQKSLPTEVEGKNFFNVTASHDGVSTLVGDTMAYYVTSMQDADEARGLIQGYRWAHDNGVIASGSEFAYGFTQENGSWYINNNDGSEGHQYSEGYVIYTRYNSPSVIPTENNEPWSINGIEYVTSTKLASLSNFGGTLINPIAIRLSMYPENGDTDYKLYYLNTGLASDDKVTVTAAAKPESEYGYTTPDMKYRAVNVTFPNQPALEPNVSYLVGYENVSGGSFSVADQRWRFSVNSDSTSTYRANSELADYANQFSPLLKVYDVIAYDPVASRSVSGWNIEVYPMIRLIVGPKIEIPTYEVLLQCDETNPDAYWYAPNYSSENICDEAYEVKEGGSVGFRVIPGAEDEDNQQGIYGNRVITEILVDGVSQNLKDTTMFVARPYNVENLEHSDWPVMLERYYYEMTLRNVTDNHTVTVKTEERELSINDVENYVKIGLAPNPATQQVRVNVAGISGMVNCSIIDMSGREVYTSKFNAGSEQVIDLNNVPAGAYFVRITNSTISKVEKLIVR